jgi:hypothetical protein
MYKSYSLSTSDMPKIYKVSTRFVPKKNVSNFWAWTYCTRKFFRYRCSMAKKAVLEESDDEPLERIQVAELKRYAEAMQGMGTALELIADLLKKHKIGEVDCGGGTTALKGLYFLSNFLHNSLMKAYGNARIDHDIPDMPVEASGKILSTRSLIRAMQSREKDGTKNGTNHP